MISVVIISSHKILMPPPKAAVRLRSPMVEDASAVHALVQSCPPLELNSPYTYLLLCSHFAASSAVGVCGDTICGFTGAYRVPDRLDTLFVWQIAVSRDLRGSGIGQLMLSSIFARQASRNIRYLEATVTPSNVASRRLFTTFAERRGCPIVLRSGFGAGDFPDGNHEAEQLFRIGTL